MTMRMFHRSRSPAIGLIFAAISATGLADSKAIHLTPNGSDDTGQLQAALESCSGAKPRCRIVLSEGVFHTDVLLVRHFKGRIRGQGAGHTIVRPIAGRPLRSTDVPFLNDPTLEEPYPILMHFADGGEIQLADFTLEFPQAMEVEAYTVGGSPVVDALLSAIMVDGTEDAKLLVSRLEIIATERPPETSLFGSALLNAIRFEGQIRLADPSDPNDAGALTRPLGSGTFIAHDTSIRGAGLGFALRDLRDVNARIVDNDVQGARFIGVFLTDMGNSQARRTQSHLFGAARRPNPPRRASAG